LKKKLHNYVEPLFFVGDADDREGCRKRIICSSMPDQKGLDR
jgi:hypothetical protein